MPKTKAKNKTQSAAKATKKTLAAKSRSLRSKPAKSSVKKSKVKPIPKGYRAITPYLHIEGAAEALKFYKKAFGAKELMRFADPYGKIMHAEIMIGDSMLMLADEFPEMDVLGPTTIGGTPVTVHLFVENVDRVTKKAIAAGATVQRPVKDQFYGDRSGSVIDPFGHVWNISTHIEDLTKKEVMKRFAKMKS